MEFRTKISFKRFFSFSKCQEPVRRERLWNDRGSFYWIYRVLYTPTKAKQLHSVNHKASINKSVAFKIFFLWRPFTQHVLLILDTQTLDADIWTTNQNIQKAWHTFVYWYFVNDWVHSFCSCCGIQYPINSLERTLVVSTLTASSHLLKGKIA